MRTTSRRARFLSVPIVIGLIIGMNVAAGSQAQAAGELDLTIGAGWTGALAVGKVITLDIVAENKSGANQTNVVIADVTINGVPNTGCTKAGVTLANTDKLDCQLTYTVTQADMDRGTLPISVKVTGTPFGEVTASRDPISLSGLVLSLGAVPDKDLRVGDTVKYNFVVINNTGETISGIAISQDKFTGKGTPPVLGTCATTLADKATATCTAEYVVTKADLDQGKWIYSGKVTAFGPNGEIVVPATSAEVTVVVSNAKMDISIKADKDKVKVGDLITYTIVVKNTGGTTLVDVDLEVGFESAMTQAQFEAWLKGASCTYDGPAIPLKPGWIMQVDKTLTCVLPPYKVTEVDVNAGKLTLTVIATSETTDKSNVPVTAQAKIETPTYKVPVKPPVQPKPPVAPTGGQVASSGASASLAVLLLALGAIGLVPTLRRQLG